MRTYHGSEVFTFGGDPVQAQPADEIMHMHNELRALLAKRLEEWKATDAQKEQQHSTGLLERMSAMFASKAEIELPQLPVKEQAGSQW